MGTAQEQMSLRDRAYATYLSGEYADAIDYYAQIYEKVSLEPDEVLAVAESYRRIEEWEQAADWYQNYLSNEEEDDNIRFVYAKVLKSMGEYETAIAEFKKIEYNDLLHAEVEKEIQGSDSARVWMENPTAHEIKNENEINTEKAEFGVWPIDGEVFYAGEPSTFTKNKSGKTGRAYLKTYSAEIDQDGLSLKYPALLEDIFNDAQYHVGPIVSSKDREQLFVTRTNPASSYENVQTEGHRFRRKNLEIIIYTKNEDSWSARPFPYNNVKEYSVGHAALNEEEDVLYFASDMPGGAGGVDIWRSERSSDGEWGEPQNLGSEVNTSGDEVFPFVYEDTLFFSSDGHRGMGGLDIFKAVEKNGTFTNVENLQYPVNSPADDFAFVISEDEEKFQKGYLSSNRTGGVGLDDVYSFTYKKPFITINLVGKVFDKETDSLLDSVDVLIKTSTGEENALLSLDGRFQTELMKNENYAISAKKKGYMEDSKEIQVGEPLADTTFVVDLYLQPVHTKGISFVLNDIYYDFDKADIRPDAAKILDKLVTVMNDNPTLRIELSSHTDSRGSDDYNMKLSERRAKSAVDYLISKGIDSSRMVAKGYGETRLVNKCANGVECTEEEHQQNRRTEIEVLDY